MIAKMDIKPASVLLGALLMLAALRVKDMVQKKEGYACCGASA